MTACSGSPLLGLGWPPELTLISTWCRSSASSISRSLLRSSAFFSSSCRRVISQKVWILSRSSWK